MDLKCIFAIFTLSVLPWSASAAPVAPKVVVKSEVASPVVLENTQDKNYLKVSLMGYPLPQEKRNPINLALVIDRSTSMSGDRRRQYAQRYQHKNKVVTREMLFDAAWGYDFLPNSRTLDQHISKLRKTIELDANSPLLIRTVHGMGYRYLG